MQTFCLSLIIIIISILCILIVPTTVANNINNNNGLPQIIKHNIVNNDNNNNPNSTTNNNSGTFWWFTDMHVDVWGNMKETPECAWTPSEQMISGLNAMKEINGEPDFILMSGDIVHFPKRNVSDLTPELILLTIEQVTAWVMKTFPNAKLYGALGNHDLSPSNNWPTTPSESKWLFDKLVDIWSPWLPETALKTLGETGWYSADVDGVPGLRIITPNTNYWAFYNTYLIFNSTIADIQWKWIESELERAWNDGVKVYINGHHPPVGQYEGNSADDFWPMYTQKYVQLMEKYHAIIVAGFFGHEHVDEFRLMRKCNYYYKPSNTSTVNNCTGDPFGVVFVGQCMSNCGSPSFREWTFDKTSMELQDYKSYVYDEAIAAASNFSASTESSADDEGVENFIVKEMDDDKPRSYASEWPLQYQWSDIYTNMDNMTAMEWEKQLDAMSKNDTLFEEFMGRRRPSNPGCTTSKCKDWMLCNYGYGTYAEFLQCAFNGYNNYHSQSLFNREIVSSGFGPN